MTARTLRLLVLAASLHAVAAPASGSVDTTSFASRYATFKQQQAQKWLLANTLNTWSGGLWTTVNRKLHSAVRTTAGHINPTNMPIFGSDLAGRAQHLDDQIGITASHAYSTGKDIVVAVLDSGFNLNHPMIASRVLPYGYDAVSHDWDPQDRGNGVDDDGDGYVDNGVGHGTFVAGTILDVAPNAWIIPVRIADDEGYGLDDEVASGIDFAISMGVNVINLSFESGTLTTSVAAELQSAYDHGITVVLSAGNDGSTTLNGLAASGTTICVGAVDDDDHIASFSNTPSNGQNLTLLAPGVTIFGPHGGPTNDATCTWSGTSFSAPQAAGAVALLLQLQPSFTQAQIKDRLRSASTASVVAWNGSTYAYAGRLDLVKVVHP